MASISGNVEAAPPPKQFIEAFLGFLQLSTGVIGVGGTVVMLMGSVFAISSNGFIPFVVLFPLILLGSVVAHETGHAISAKLSRMTVLEMRVGPFQCVMQRRGVRIRWRALPEMKRARLSGYVIVIPSLERSLRKQRVWCALGGPLSNFAIALFAALIGYVLLPDPIAFLGFAVAWLNLMMGIGNLMPTKGLIGSDGKQLLHWLKTKDCKISPYERLLALLIRGETADELPSELIDALDASPLPMSFIALHVRLQAHQNCARWDAACEVEKDFDRILSETPKATAEALSDLLAIIRTELAFSKTMHHRDGAHLKRDLLPHTTAWLVPYLWPRCVALCEGLAGNLPARDRLLELAMRHAKKSVDLSVWRSETLLHDYIRAI